MGHQEKIKIKIHTTHQDKNMNMFIDIFMISLFVAWFSALYLLSTKSNTAKQKIVPFNKSDVGCRWAGGRRHKQPIRREKRQTVYQVREERNTLNECLEVKFAIKNSSTNGLKIRYGNGINKSSHIIGGLTSLLRRYTL